MKFDRLLLTFILNIIMIILTISSIVVEIIDIQNNPDSVYQNIWGLFRFYTIDGNLLSLIFNIIVSISQFKALRISPDGDVKSIIATNFLYIICLMSACTELVIFIVVVLIFMPIGDDAWRKGLVGSYNASSFHVTVPIILTFRFIFLDVRKRDLKVIEKFIGGAPTFLYGIIMFILCISKVFKSYDKEIENGDGKVPYPFLDVYHQNWLFCFGCGLFIFVFGFGMGFLLDFLNKKCEKLILPYKFIIEKEEELKDEVKVEIKQETKKEEKVEIEEIEQKEKEKGIEELKEPSKENIRISKYH